MKRREFLVGSAGAIGAALPLANSLAALPCPPPTLSVDGGGSVATPCKAVQLADLAGSLARGQSTTSLNDTGLSAEALYTIQWSNRFHVDVARNRAHLLGKEAASTGSERSNCLYDMSTNRWTYSIYGGDELGHVYESFAYAPAHGEVYAGQWSGRDTLKRWAYNNPLNQWTDPATSNYGDTINPDTQPALCWHPNLFGPGDGGVLALKQEGSSEAWVIAWRRSNNRWYNVEGTVFGGMSGTYRSNGSIEYVAGGDYCIASYSPDKGGRTFRINAGSGGVLAKAVQIENVPVHCGYSGGSTVGVLVDDPSGAPTPYILEKRGTDRVWKYSEGNWVLQSYKHPFSVSSGIWVVASCRTLGVFWAKYSRTDTPSRIWRPNA